MADVEKAQLTPNESTSLNEAPQETPSSNDSVTGKVKDVRSKSTGKVDMARKLSVLFFCNTVSLTISILLSVAIPVASIVIGVLYKRDCTLNSWIPTYLVVGGSVVLFRAVLNTTELIHKDTKKEREEYSRSMVYTCCDVPIILFLIFWLIAGSVAIFGVDEVDYYDSSSPIYCKSVLFNFAYFVTLATYILLVAPLVLACCVSCITCCGLCA